MAKMSENSVKVLSYLKEHANEKLTGADVAEALDITAASVNGVFTSFQKKGLGVREEATIEGTKETSFIVITETGKDVDTKEMSETAQAIVAHLIAIDGEDVTLDDLADAIGVDKRKVNGSLNSLVKKEICARVPVTVAAPVTVKYLKLTAEGMAFDPDAQADAE